MSKIETPPKYPHEWSMFRKIGGVESIKSWMSLEPQIKCPWALQFHHVCSRHCPHRNSCKSRISGRIRSSSPENLMADTFEDHPAGHCTKSYLAVFIWNLKRVVSTRVVFQPVEKYDSVGVIPNSLRIKPVSLFCRSHITFLSAKPKRKTPLPVNLLNIYP